MGLADDRHVDNPDGDLLEASAVAPQSDGATPIQLELQPDEANALQQWLLKSMHEGATALDEPLVSGTLQKLSHELEFVNTVSAVRASSRGLGSTRPAWATIRSPIWRAASARPTAHACTDARAGRAERAWTAPVGSGLRCPGPT